MKKRLYRCRKCGYLSPQWLGRCPNCGEWESFDEVTATAVEEASGQAASVDVKPIPLAQVEPRAGERRSTGMKEFDRVLGGGAIPGSVILIGGEPGVGKSTLLLQAAAGLCKQHKVLYVSGEEAPAQLKLRAARLGLEATEELLVLTESHLELIARAVRELHPGAAIIDSIQTVVPAGEKAAEPGSTKAVGLAAFQLAQLARELELPIFLVGHITKSGEFAGPKAIEHLVDVVLYLESGQGQEGDLRLLRAVKNRYGSIDELGLFRMSPRGLIEVQNPSEFFTRRGREPQPGSVIVPSMEGTRPILVEVQALVSGGRYAGGYPQRRVTGLDYNRVAILLAVIEKRLGIQIGNDDVYLNVAGGLALREPALDLGVLAAVVSSYRNKAIDRETVVVGEVGLGGEVRPVRRLRERLTEAAKLGYRQAVVPPPVPKVPGIETLPAQDVEEAVAALALD